MVGGSHKPSDSFSHVFSHVFLVNVAGKKSVLQLDPPPPLWSWWKSQSQLSQLLSQLSRPYGSDSSHESHESHAVDGKSM